MILSKTGEKNSGYRSQEHKKLHAGDQRDEGRAPNVAGNHPSYEKERREEKESSKLVAKRDSLPGRSDILKNTQ